MSNKVPPGLTADELRALAVPTELPSSEICNRLTSQFMMSHEACGNDPIQSPASFSHAVLSDEQPYMRRFNLDTTTRPVDLGWMQAPSYIVILNKTTGHEKAFVGKPTLDMIDAARNACIELFLGEAPLSLVWPGRFTVVACHPAAPRLQWRANGNGVEGGVRATVYAYPG